MQPNDILTYCHIGKVGGKQMHFYLRSHFGYRFRGVAHALERHYQPSDLALELKINPGIRYLGGHDVRPNIDFGELDTRLKWFSFFRDPYERLLSHYYQQSSKPDFQSHSLLEWLEHNPNRAYWNIYMMAGENNLAKAQAVIDAKFCFVGLTAHYEESLFLLARQFELEGFRFNNKKDKAPPEDQTTFLEIAECAEKNRTEINFLLADEIALYQHVCDKYQQQVDNYGRDKLSNDLNSYLATTPPINKNNFNNGLALTLEHGLWRPLYHARKFVKGITTKATTGT